MTCIKHGRLALREHARMHYHYFTIEQRETLAQAIRARLAEPGMAAALERLHRPEFGVCQACGADIAFVRLEHEPRLVRCPTCGGKI